MYIPTSGSAAAVVSGVSASPLPFSTGASSVFFASVAAAVVSTASSFAAVVVAAGASGASTTFSFSSSSLVAGGTTGVLSASSTIFSVTGVVSLYMCIIFFNSYDEEKKNEDCYNNANISTFSLFKAFNLQENGKKSPNDP